MRRVHLSHSPLALSHAQRYSAQNLSNMLWALAKLGFRWVL
jgi:hypothetical protein